MQQTINIRPSARILRVLGDIEFDNWQCLAELADNAFDDFLEIERAGLHWPDGCKVSITLPTAQTAIADAEVIVQDTGRGMDLETLNNAVRAGWSGNDQFSKLGLFGMGFNIATARLGRFARVLTSRAGETEWVGIEIDLNNIGDDFDAPVIAEPKADVADHGTRVTVGRLDGVRAGWLARNQPLLRKMLGNVYSYLLEQKPFELYINGVRVTPRRACRWGENRSITYGTGQSAEQIPAYFPIDQRLPPAETCLDCRNWQPPGKDTCDQCGGSDLVERERRVHGWLGIQRYLDKTEYGIDFFRNGRKILRSSKLLFEWTNPNDPLGGRDVEYPVELGQGGRIIGEIHLDHVPVNYQKNAFEWSDRNWIAAVEFLRGSSPLLPKKAQQLGLPPNQSPLAKLHRGYRRNDPGYRCLIPGDGTGPIHDETRRWAKEFYDGNPEYETDQKWWEAVENHERLKAAKEAGAAGRADGDPESGSVLEDLGLVTPTESDDSRDGASGEAELPRPTRESEQERLTRYRQNASIVPELSGEFGLVEFGASVRVTTYAVADHEVQDNAGFRTPVLLARQEGTNYSAFIDATHPVFADFVDDPADFLVLELANQLKTRAEHEMPLAQAVALLKERHLTDRKVDMPIIAGQARELLRIIRERMADAIKGNPDRAWQFLTVDERIATENNLVADRSGLSLEQAQTTGDFLLFTPPMFVPRLLEEWPDAFMDGAVFAGPFLEVGSPAGRRLSVSRIVGYLYDVALLCTVQAPMLKEQLVRARVSIQLLPGELAPDPVPQQ